MPENARSVLTNRLRAGDLTIDVGARTVSQGGRETRLPRLSFRFLEVLIEAAPNLVSADELVTKVWDGRPVTPETIAQRALLVRQALEDDVNNPRYIESIRGEGYRFVASVQPLAADRADRDRTMYQSRGAWFSAVALLAIGTAATLWLAPDGRAPAESLAVLPFQDLSPSGDHEYLAEGVSEELLNHVAQSTDLSVTARTSAFSFKGQQLPATEIADELGVDILIDGSLRVEGDRLRVSVQMIDGESGENLSTQQFDGFANEFFDLQERIAAAVVAELGNVYLEEDQPSANPDPAAFMLFLQARQLNHQNNPRDAALAEPLLTRALEIEPEFPLALAELARSTFIQGPDASDPQGMLTVWETCIDLIDQAYAMDPTQPFVLAWRAWIDILFRRDPTSGFKELERALAIDPQDDDALRLASFLYLAAGRYDRIIQLSEGLLERDPLCVICHFAVAAAMTWSDQIEMSEASLLYLAEVTENTRRAHTMAMLGALYLVTDRAEEALDLFESGSVEEPYATRGRLLALYELGRNDEFEQEFAAKREQWDTSESSSIEVLASIYAWTGDSDSAFELLNEGLEQHNDVVSPYLPAKGPYLRNLKDDPRWPSLQERARPAPQPAADSEADR